MAKRGRKRRSGRKRTSKRRVRRISRPKRRKTTVARRRKGSRRGSRKSIGGFLKGGMVGNVVKGLGAGALATIVLQRVAPQFTGIGSVGAGFLGGGVVGGVANLFLTGGLSSLGGLFGGGGGQDGGDSI